METLKSRINANDFDAYKQGEPAYKLGALLYGENLLTEPDSETNFKVSEFPEFQYSFSAKIEENKNQNLKFFAEIKQIDFNLSNQNASQNEAGISYKIQFTDRQLLYYDPQEAAMIKPNDQANIVVYGRYQANIQIDVQKYSSSNQAIKTDFDSKTEKFFLDIGYKKENSSIYNEGFSLKSNKPVTIGFLKRKLLESPGIVNAKQENNSLVFSWQTVESANTYAVYLSPQPKINPRELQPVCKVSDNNCTYDLKPSDFNTRLWYCVVSRAEAFQSICSFEKEILTELRNTTTSTSTSIIPTTAIPSTTSTTNINSQTTTNTTSTTIHIPSTSTTMTQANNINTTTTSSTTTTTSSTTTTTSSTTTTTSSTTTTTSSTTSTTNTSTTLLSRYKNNGDGTFTDNQNSLVWQQNPDNQSYSWDEAKTYCTNLRIGGFSDWRLPNPLEMIKQMDYTKLDPSADSVFSSGAFGYYWTSSMAIADTHFWGAEFSQGGLNPRHRSLTPAHVRCVRGTAISYHSSGYVVTQTTVSHSALKLTWERNINSQTRNWTGAEQYCNSLVINGVSGWRLPTVQELHTLIDYSLSVSPKLDTTLFPNTLDGRYWTSERYLSLNSGWTISMSGLVEPQGATSSHYTRCVRALSRVRFLKNPR